MLRVDNIFIPSILHLAVYHGREQLASKLLQRIQQLLPLTDVPLLESENINGYVSVWAKLSISTKNE